MQPNEDDNNPTELSHIIESIPYDAIEIDKSWTPKPSLKTWEPTISFANESTINEGEENSKTNNDSDTEDENEDIGKSANKKAHGKHVQFTPNPLKITTPRKTTNTKANQEQVRQQYIKPICWSYRLGIPCRFRNNCRFRHTIESDGDEVCNSYFQNYRCRFKERCRYYHVTEEDRDKIYNNENNMKMSSRYNHKDNHYDHTYRESNRDRNTSTMWTAKNERGYERSNDSNTHYQFKKKNDHQIQRSYERGNEDSNQSNYDSRMSFLEKKILEISNHLAYLPTMNSNMIPPKTNPSVEQQNYLQQLQSYNNQPTQANYV